MYPLDYVEVEQVSKDTWRAHGNNGVIKRGPSEREAVALVFYESGLEGIELTVPRISLGRKDTHAIYAIVYEDLEWMCVEGRCRFETEEEVKRRNWLASLRSRKGSTVATVAVPPPPRLPGGK